MKLDFILEKETKGALRYQQVDKNGQPKSIDAGAEVGTLYLRKSAFNGSGFPKNLKVNIETA
jgi:hypothetical protein